MNLKEKNAVSICTSCSTEFVGNFCNECGQRKYARISKSYVVEEMQSMYFATEKGFFYSIKNILLNPGRTARKFVEGDRVNHYKPIMLAFVLSGVAAFIAYQVIGLGDMANLLYKDNPKMNTPAMQKILGFMTNYYSLVMLSLIPFFALLTKMAFKSWENNYYEHVVMNAFYQCYFTLLSIFITYPIFYFFRDNIYFGTTFFVMLATPGLLFWFFKGFYSEKSWGEVLGRVFIVFAMVALSYILLIVLMMIVTFVAVMIFGPENVKIFLPQKI